MARDFENLDDIEAMTDEELRALVRDALADAKGLDHEDMVVRASNGEVTLSGRVGTDQEVRIAERILSDVLGLRRFTSELVVDPNRRAESPIAIDEHLADEAEHEGLLLGDRAIPIAPETEHLADDVDARLVGTTDVQDAIERGTPWIPPSGPTPEGMTGSERDPLD